MDILTPNQPKAFTVPYPTRVSVLKTPVGVGPPFDPKQESPPIDASLDLGAIWDTGATGTVITKSLAEKLDLKPIDLVVSKSVSGTFESNVYLVSLWLPNIVCIPVITVIEADIGLADVLIGMDVISQGDFAVTNMGGNTTFTFRIPSTECIDFAEIREQPGRNQPCPCGSGKKYKRCHGR